MASSSSAERRLMPLPSWLHVRAGRCAPPGDLPGHDASTSDVPYTSDISNRYIRDSLRYVAALVSAVSARCQRGERGIAKHRPVQRYRPESTLTPVSYTHL